MTYKELHEKLKDLTYARLRLNTKVLQAIARPGFEGLVEVNREIYDNWEQTLNLLDEMEKLNALSNHE